MRDIDLFQLALGLVPPWMVADAKFDAEKKRLDIEIDFKVGARRPGATSISFSTRPTRAARRRNLTDLSMAGIILRACHEPMPLPARAPVSAGARYARNHQPPGRGLCNAAAMTAIPHQHGHHDQKYRAKRDGGAEENEEDQRHEERRGEGSQANGAGGRGQPRSRPPGSRDKGL
jgi:hypothetical protein